MTLKEGIFLTILGKSIHKEDVDYLNRHDDKMKVKNLVYNSEMLTDRIYNAMSNVAITRKVNK